MRYDFTKNGLNEWLYYQDENNKSRPLPMAELNSMTQKQYDGWQQFATKLRDFALIIKKELDLTIDSSKITSSFRSKERNAKCEGSIYSKHYTHWAIDIQDHDKKIANLLLKLNKKQDLKQKFVIHNLRFIIDYKEYNIVHIQDLDFSDKSKMVFSKKEQKFLI